MWWKFEKNQWNCTRDIRCFLFSCNPFSTSWTKTELCGNFQHLYRDAKQFLCNLSSPVIVRKIFLWNFIMLVLVRKIVLNLAINLLNTLPFFHPSWKMWKTENNFRKRGQMLFCQSLQNPKIRKPLKFCDYLTVGVIRCWKFI